jgi:preprotein translocase subunit SecF
MTVSAKCCADSGSCRCRVLNASVNQTLSRSVITHVTVSLALLALLFGGQAIHSFTATMMFGVVLVGTYTSVSLRRS